jgi:CBS domain-containing protein
MPTVAQIMTTEVMTVGPQQTLQFAAQLMERHDVGALPVCCGQMLLGIVTDRDITVRGTAAGLTPSHGCVSDVMSRYPSFCAADLDVADALRRMGEEQIHRLPVVDAAGALLGIVSLADLATRQTQSIDQLLRDICEPLPMSLQASRMKGGIGAMAPKALPGGVQALPQ